MFTTLVLVAALSAAPGQPSLALNNVRSTYGMLGVPRTSNKLLPGDLLVIDFDIEGIQVDAEGKVLYSIGLEAADNTGKVLFKQAPKDAEAILALGGRQLSAFATLQIGLDQQPGPLVVKVTVTDRATRAAQSFTNNFEVLPKAFGLVRLALTTDPDGRIPAVHVGQGQSIWVNFVAIGFGRGDGGKGQPSLAVTLRILDENSRPTLSKPFQGEVSKDVPANALFVPMQFVLDLNRAGKFTLQVEATDKVSGKTASLAVPLTVLKAN